MHYPVQPSDTLLNGSHNCGCGNDVHFMNYTRKFSGEWAKSTALCNCVCVHVCKYVYIYVVVKTINSNSIWICVEVLEQEANTPSTHRANIRAHTHTNIGHTHTSVLTEWMVNALRQVINLLAQRLSVDCSYVWHNMASVTQADRQTDGESDSLTGESSLGGRPQIASVSMTRQRR